MLWHHPPLSDRYRILLVCDKDTYTYANNSWNSRDRIRDLSIANPTPYNHYDTLRRNSLSPVGLPAFDHISVPKLVHQLGYDW